VVRPSGRSEQEWVGRDERRGAPARRAPERGSCAASEPVVGAVARA